MQFNSRSCLPPRVVHFAIYLGKVGDTREFSGPLRQILNNEVFVWELASGLAYYEDIETRM